MCWSTGKEMEVQIFRTFSAPISMLDRYPGPPLRSDPGLRIYRTAGAWEKASYSVVSLLQYAFTIWLLKLLFF